MNPSQITLIQDLARQIAAESAINQWPYWLVLVAIMMVVAATSSWLGAYFAKRGEAQAVKDGFESIRMQLRETTKTVEKIKVEIAHEDWNARELKTTRRAKLERLFALTWAVPRYLEARRNQVVFQEEIQVDSDPTDEITAICALYFPQLNDAAKAVAAEKVFHLSAFYEARLKMLDEGNAQGLKGFKEKQAELNVKLDAANEKLRLSALELAPTVIGSLS